MQKSIIGGNREFPRTGNLILTVMLAFDGYESGTIVERAQTVKAGDFVLLPLLYCQIRSLYGSDFI